MSGSLTVDLNCDLGESFGAYCLGQDEEILPLVSSANIACGFHAGDPAVMKKTVDLALRHGVALGAHPGLPDLAGFGRREMALSAEEVYDLVVYQLGALGAFVTAAGAHLHHVKPHGALYNMAATQEPLAAAMAEAIAGVYPEAILYGLAGSALIKAGQKRGLRTAQEVFADRTYQADGTLTPRRQPGALISDPALALAQVLRLVQQGEVVSQSGEVMLLRADTICLHGDGPHALTFARELRQALAAAGITVKAPGHNQLL